MGLFDSLSVSASGLTAERTRMDVTAENLANAQTTQAPGGGPYRRKSVELTAIDPGGNDFAALLAGAQGPSQAGAPGGTQVKVTGIVEDNSAPKMVYDPGNPDANAQGYVAEPNVDTVSEMVDLITEQRAYEADTTAMNTAKTMYSKTLDILH